jgi:thiamine thiazole synthase
MAPVATSEKYAAPASDVQKYNILEDYHGGYRFAPIEEAQVSRAMIKRWVPGISSTIPILRTG